MFGIIHYCIMYKKILPGLLFEIASPAQMSLWEAAASDVFSSNYLPGNSVDGNSNSHWLSSGADGATHSWIKIKMDMERWVKGVGYKVRSSAFAVRNKYLEVRANVCGRI